MEAAQSLRGVRLKPPLEMLDGSFGRENRYLQSTVRIHHHCWMSLGEHAEGKPPLTSLDRFQVARVGEMGVILICKLLPMTSVNVINAPAGVHGQHPKTGQGCKSVSLRDKVAKHVGPFHLSDPSHVEPLFYYTPS